MRRTVIILLTICFFGPSVTFGNFFDDVAETLGDPLNLGESVEGIGEIVDRLNIYLAALQGELDADVRAYIAEGNAIIEKVNVALKDRISDVDATIRAALADVSALELQIYGHTKQLLVCGPALMQRSVEEMLATSINQLAEARPGIDIFGFRIVDFSVSASDIKDPITDYKLLMIAYRKMMSKLTDISDANIIPNALGEMQRLTLRTKCFYEGTTTEIELVAEFAKLRAEATPWIGLTSFVVEDLSK